MRTELEPPGAVRGPCGRRAVQSGASGSAGGAVSRTCFAAGGESREVGGPDWKVAGEEAVGASYSGCLWLGGVM